MATPDRRSVLHAGSLLRQTGKAFAALTLGSGGLLLAALAIPVPAGAEDPVHRVTYTVTADQPLDVDIYYRDVDPPTWADYSHNPYQYSPKAEAVVGPETSWVRDVMLADPAHWAMVAVTGGASRTAHSVHCDLAVDGIVVATANGPDGALCSLRHW